MLLQRLGLLKWIGIDDHGKYWYNGIKDRKFLQHIHWQCIHAHDVCGADCIHVFRSLSDFRLKLAMQVCLYTYTRYDQVGRALLAGVPKVGADII